MTVNGYCAAIIMRFIFVVEWFTGVAWNIILVGGKVVLVLVANGRFVAVAA